MSNTKDSNGKELNTGDAVILTQELQPKGFREKLKRGTTIKNIRLDENNPEVVDCKIGKSIIVIKTCYLKKK